MKSPFVIKRGTVIDGTGAPAARLDVRVRDGVIVEVAPALEPGADERVVEADGREVLPGFVDVHSHDDAALLREAAMDPKLSQGVTTTVIGNCGHGCAPTGDRAMIEEYSRPVLGDFPEQDFGSFGEFISVLADAPLALNSVALVPHGPLRAAVTGPQRRAAGGAEVDAICGGLDEALSAGAAGLSFGLMYSPGNAADPDELRRIAETVARRGKLLVAHVRNEADRLEASLQEFLDLGRATGCALHVSHLKVTGPGNFGTMPRVIDLLDRARDEGLDVTADVYPYSAGSTTAVTLFPSWSADRGAASLLEALSDPETRRRVLRELRAPWDGPLENYFASLGPEKLLLAGFVREENLPFEGRPLSEIAARRGADPADCLADLMLEEAAGLTVVLFQTDIAGMETALAWPHTLVGSDGLPRERGYVHPRLFGTFPRVLARYAGPGRPLGREEAVRRMTGASARRFGVEAGVVAEGMPADLQIIDPGCYGDTADFADPRSLTTGVERVFVAGEAAWEGGRPTGVAAGTQHRVSRIGASR
ncbi:amidohydrolase family protein [Leucobacter sp. CSA1]|uniref:Amidohydrolase family protein n=1 Tax=Leucobacter chromiisoli TaxID=2796471 RepID=A0A934Q7R7_9MICO|nr:amidohydrolase family protein [Leucobacter chromiisoli]MBK0418651.1 amidohydrolase family protein [Leucobacter chromiisoli]